MGSPSRSRLAPSRPRACAGRDELTGGRRSLRRIVPDRRRRSRTPCRIDAPRSDPGRPQRRQAAPRSASTWARPGRRPCWSARTARSPGSPSTPRRPRTCSPGWTRPCAPWSPRPRTPGPAAAGLLVRGRGAAAGGRRHGPADRRGGGAPGGPVGRVAGGARARRAAGPGRRAAAARQPARRRAADRRRGRRRPGSPCCTTPPGWPGPACGSRSCSPATPPPATTRWPCSRPPAARSWPAPTSCPGRGELRPGPARAAVAELYAHHVLGGRGPAAAPRFRRLVRVGTPDAVGSGAALLAACCGRPGAGRRHRLRDHRRALAVPDAAADRASRVRGAPPRATWACARPPRGCSSRARPRGSSTRSRPTCSARRSSG